MRLHSSQNTASTVGEPDNEHFFVASVYSNGLMTATVEESGDDVVDGTRY